MGYNAYSSGHIVIPADTTDLLAALNAAQYPDDDPADIPDQPLIERVADYIGQVHAIALDEPHRFPGGPAPVDGELDAQGPYESYHEDHAVWQLLAAAGVEGDLEFQGEDDHVWRIVMHQRRAYEVNATSQRVWPKSPLDGDAIGTFTRQEARAILALATGDAHPHAAALIARATEALT